MSYRPQSEHTSADADARQFRGIDAVGIAIAAWLGSAGPPKIA